VPCDSHGGPRCPPVTHSNRCVQHKHQDLVVKPLPLELLRHRDADHMRRSAVLQANLHCVWQPRPEMTLFAAGHFCSFLPKLSRPGDPVCPRLTVCVTDLLLEQDQKWSTSGLCMSYSAAVFVLCYLQEALNMVIPAMQLAGKIPDVHVQLWASALLKGIYPL